MSLPWGGTWLSKERGRTHPHTHTHIPYRNVKMENILRPVRPGDIYGQLLCQLPLMAAPRPLFEALTALAGINLPRPLLPPPQLPGQFVQLFPYYMFFLLFFLSHFHLFSFFLFWLRALCPIFYYIVWTIFSPTLSLSISLQLWIWGNCPGLVWFISLCSNCGLDLMTYERPLHGGWYFPYFPCVPGGMYFPPYNYPLNIYKFLRTYFKLKSEKKSASSIDL